MEWFLSFALSAAYLVGLGFFIWLPAIWFDRARGLRWSDVGILIIAGVLLHYLYSLCVKQWLESPPYFAFLAVVGWLGFGISLVYWRRLYGPFAWRICWPWLVAFAVIVSVYFFKILYDPLWAHDARSIWFFAGKVLYFAGGWGSSEVWNFPDNHLYHFDYPKLIPILAAHTAWVAGFWNEHLPKLSLFLLFLPIVFFLYDWREKIWAALFLLCALLGVPGSHLWTGYMDGFFAVYAALGVLFWLQADSSRSLRHHVVAVLCFSVMVALKGEGVLFLAAFLCARILFNGKSGAGKAWQAAPYLLAFLPAVIWSVVRSGLMLQPWPDILSGDVGGRIYGRFVSAEVLHPILSAVFWRGRILAALAPLALCLWFARQGAPFAGMMRFPLLVGGIYGVFLVSIYMMTPLDLEFHVSQSVERTCLPIVLMVLLSVAQWIRAGEPGSCTGRKQV